MRRRRRERRNYNMLRKQWKKLLFVWIIITNIVMNNTSVQLNAQQKSNVDTVDYHINSIFTSINMAPSLTLY